ncbi:MAG TPA: tRNA (guanosine(37)-N1)-methyltransferase TrmD, partial [Abditibacteriaceae bacterium]|nr:tRNA (guanosine(37)-N1)-methyltransferase TrmD [Abditibacteriaceae bacterium]
MQFDIFTLFPAFFEGPFGNSILQRARASGVLRIALHDVRDWAEGRHRVCDDYPYGGGAGMVMKAEPVAAAVEDVLNFKAGHENPPCPVILMSPQGRTFTQSVAEELSTQPRIALLCGHYEGVDE